MVKKLLIGQKGGHRSMSTPPKYATVYNTFSLL